ncbi:uncharacterized protein LOC125828065 [Solanum verrucosum]|uniref:uncharacterized protein LOC125828065 n=1 Tax=Solanum verrucosum TaxID=315347 RepID=UPI0020D10210|nr:uncharacterized protein LOC125828065 [Solanum verrucosum]
MREFLPKVLKVTKFIKAIKFRWIPPAMSNEEVRSALLMMAQAVTTQAQAMTAQAITSMTHVNPIVSTIASRLRDFVRMSPLIFLGSKVGEDPQEFIDEVYKVVNNMKVTFIQKVELSYRLKDVSQVWFTQWKSNRPVGAGPIEWEDFKKEFLGRFLPHEKREAKVEEFINLNQGSMSVQSMVSNPRDEMSRYVTGVSKLVEKECRTEMLKIKKKNREMKRSRFDEQGQPRYFEFETKHGHYWAKRNNAVERMKKRRPEDRLNH